MEYNVILIFIIKRYNNKTERFDIILSSSAVLKINIINQYNK